MALQDMYAPTDSGYSDPNRDMAGGAYDWSGLTVDPQYFSQMDSMRQGAAGYQGTGDNYSANDQFAAFGPDAGRNPLDFFKMADGSSLSQWGKQANAEWNPQTNSFNITRRVDAPGTAGWNDDRKYHYESANFGLGGDGRSLTQNGAWNQQAKDSSWMGTGPAAMKGLAMMGSLGALGAAGMFGETAAGAGGLGSSSAAGMEGIGSAMSGADVGGAIATGVPESAASGIGLESAGSGGLEGVFGAKPMATPIPGANVSGVGMNMTPAPGFGGGSAYSISSPELSASLYGGGAGAGAAPELMSEASREAPQSFHAADNYGPGMSGAETGVFDSVLGLTGSPSFASGATEFAGPMMDNPVFDQLKRFKELLGQKAVGGLSYGDLGRGAMSAMNYRQNSKNLKSQEKSLKGLYGQDGSYAKAMRQQLERRDAAAGRRSQYGPREVELQAALAGNAAKLAPTLQQNDMAQNALRNRLYGTAGVMLDKGLGTNFLGKLFGG